MPAVAANQPPPANKPPHAAFAITPPSVSGSLQVAVDGSGSSDPDGTIASYAWSFGDGGSATGATASHTYLAAGTFTITLTVTDNSGAKGTATQQVTVPIPPPPAPQLPPPVKGVSVNVLPFLGTVLVNGKPLVAGQQIPFGATIDTTHGTILIQDIGPTGELEAAYFAGAIFKLTKTAAGLTELVLQGGDFSVCTAKAKRHTAAAGQPPKKKTVVRSLWGNGKGQFVTKGKLCGRDRPRHDLEHAGPLRRHVRPGPAGHRLGAGPRAQQDDQRHRRPHLPRAPVARNPGHGSAVSALNP